MPAEVPWWARPPADPAAERPDGALAPDPAPPLDPDLAAPTAELPGDPVRCAGCGVPGRWTPDGVQRVNELRLVTGSCGRASSGHGPWVARSTAEEPGEALLRAMRGHLDEQPPDRPPGQGRLLA